MAEIEAMYEFDQEPLATTFQTLRSHVTSERFEKRVARYKVSDDDIKDMLYVTSTRELCKLADMVIMDYLPEDYTNEAELNKIIDIAAMGTVRKYLTDKQKWALSSFCLYYLQSGKAVI
jgi:hypothetical protein